MNPNEKATPLRVVAAAHLPLPLMTSRVHAGFPSPADDHAENTLDLTAKFVRSPASSFFMEVEGESMTGVHIANGDYVLVDRSREPRDGDVVVVEVDGDRVLRLFCETKRAPLLAAAHPGFAPIEWRENCLLCGVVTSLHRNLLAPRT